MRERPRPMSEAELLTQFMTLGQAFLSGLMATFSILSAYVVALYTFLSKSPMPLKVTAFTFFTVILLLLGVFLVGALTYADGVATALTRKSLEDENSALGELVVGLVNHKLAYFLAFMSVLVGCAVYAALAYLTFVYEWMPYGSA